jgi:hypothetical protein
VVLYGSATLCLLGIVREEGDGLEYGEGVWPGTRLNGVSSYAFWSGDGVKPCIDDRCGVPYVRSMLCNGDEFGTEWCRPLYGVPLCTDGGVDIIWSGL